MCPSLGLVGSWTQLQDVITTWLTNRTRAKGEDEAGYQKLEKLELGLPAKVQKLWEAATPVDQLTKPQFNELLRNLRQVQRDFNQEDFQFHYSQFYFKTCKKIPPFRTHLNYPFHKCDLT